MNRALQVKPEHSSEDKAQTNDEGRETKTPSGNGIMECKKLLIYSEIVHKIGPGEEDID
jgi:hypothetical protein